MSVFSYLLVPEELGTYNVIFAGVMLSNSLLFQWLRVTIARYIHKYEDITKQEFVNTVLKFGKITLFISLIVSTIIVCFKPDQLAIYTLGFIWLIVYSVYDVNLELQRSSLQAKTYAKSELIRSVLFVILSISLAYVYRSFISIVVAYILSQSVPLLIYKDKNLSSSGKGFAKAESVDILKYGIPLALMLSSSFINNVIDKLLIAEFLGNKEAGLYSVGFDLYRQAIWVPFLIINMTNFPMLVKIYEEKKESLLLQKMKENGNTLLIVATVLGSLLFLVSKEITSLFIGEAYRTSATLIMPYIVVSTVLYGLSIFHYNNSFQFKGRTDKLAYIYLTGSVFKIIINVFFLQQYGIIVAAYSTVLTYVLIMLLSIIIGKREYYIPHPNFNYMWSLLVVSALLYYLFSILDINNIYAALILKSTISILFYVIILIKLNIIRIDPMIEKLKFISISKRTNV
ncbi:hypothetical protein GCM10027299_08890 [Larkinella ripae]